MSSCGDWLYNVALLALVYARTGSATWVALTTSARVLPMVVLGPFGGALADRRDRRRLIIASDLVRAALMVALAAVAATGLPIVLAPLLAAAAVAAAAVQPPCVAACTARLVSDAELQRANALRAAIGQGALVVGPALGAVVLVVTAPSVAILLNALTFVASALAICAIGPDPAFRPAPTHDAERPSLWTDVRTGARALRAAPTAVRLVAADMLCSGVYGLLTVTLVLVSRRVGAGAGGYGLLLGAFGVGGLIGAAVAGRLDAVAVARHADGGAGARRAGPGVTGPGPHAGRRARPGPALRRGDGGGRGALRDGAPAPARGGRTGAGLRTGAAGRRRRDRRGLPPGWPARLPGRADRRLDDRRPLRPATAALLLRRPLTDQPEQFALESPALLAG